MNEKLLRLWDTKTKDDEWWSSFVTAPLAIATARDGLQYLIVYLPGKPFFNTVCVSRSTRYSAKATSPAYRVHSSSTRPIPSSSVTDSPTAGVNSGSNGFSRGASWQPSRSSANSQAGNLWQEAVRSRSSRACTVSISSDQSVRKTGKNLEYRERRKESARDGM